MSLTLDSILSFVFRPRIKEHLIKMLMHTHVCVCVDQLSFFRPKRDLMDCFLFPILVVLTFSTMIKACVLLIHPQKNKKKVPLYYHAHSNIDFYFTISDKEQRRKRINMTDARNNSINR